MPLAATHVLLAVIIADLLRTISFIKNILQITQYF